MRTELGEVGMGGLVYSLYVCQRIAYEILINPRQYLSLGCGITAVDILGRVRRRGKSYNAELLGICGFQRDYEQISH